MIQDIRNFLKLTEKLSTSGMPKPEEFKELSASGVKFVVNLATPKSEDWIRSESNLVADSGMKYLSIQVDWENPTQKNLLDFMDAMDVHKNEKIHVHCQANFRATAFVSLYQILRLGMKREDVFPNLHKIWNPDEYPIWKKFIEDNLPKS